MDLLEVLNPGCATSGCTALGAIFLSIRIVFLLLLFLLFQLKSRCGCHVGRVYGRVDRHGVGVPGRGGRRELLAVHGQQARPLLDLVLQHRQSSVVSDLVLFEFCNQSKQESMSWHMFLCLLATIGKLS